jgi:hypothetical protein
MYELPIIATFIRRNLMSDTAVDPAVPVTPADQANQAAQQVVEAVKKTGFFKQLLIDKGDSPSSKRFVAFITVFLGMLVGTVISGIVVTGWLRPELVANIPATALPVLETGLSFVQFFITALFTLGGVALGLTIPEWFSKRFTPKS